MNDSQLLNMMYFSITNLKYWTCKEKLIGETLKLLNELAIGYTSVRKLVQLPEIQYLLNNHTVSTRLSFNY